MFLISNSRFNRTVRKLESCIYFFNVTIVIVLMPLKNLVKIKVDESLFYVVPDDITIFWDMMIINFSQLKK